MEAIQYKGHTIQADFRNPYNKECEYMFYPTSEGVQHDADCDGDGYHYCGNCKWAASIDEAKDLITEKIMTLAPSWRVTTPNPLVPDKENITKFDWIVDALLFAIKVNGNLPQIQSI
jgi:hypothetical protein